MKNQFPQRKTIRLHNHNYSASCAYFITVCVQDRKPILSTISPSFVGVGAFDVPRRSPKIQLTDLGKIVERYLLSSQNISGVEIDRYVIMPDHIHAILFVHSNKLQAHENGTSKAPSPTNEMLPHVISTFKRFCNKEIGYNIFQRGYFEHIIRNREDYEAIAKYIYENPIRWLYQAKE